MSKLDAAIQKQLDAARADIILLRKHCEGGIFGLSQKQGIRVTTNGFFVPTQFELISRPVSHVVLVGEAGSGKTALADFIFRKFEKTEGGFVVANVTKIVG